VSPGRSVPRALTVDAWYTLVYVTPAEHRSLEARRWRVWSVPLQAQGFSSPQIRRWLAHREHWAAGLEARGRTPTVPEQIRAVGRWSRARLDVSDLARQLDRALLASEVRIAAGARTALRSLEDAGVPLGLVSNVMNESGAAARQVLDRLDLLRRFRTVVLSCEHRWAKPSPRPFRLACDFLEVEPGSAAHLGDLDYDLRGARAAGMRAWWYTGLRRWNRYLPGQVDANSIRPGETIASWADVAGRFEEARPREPFRTPTAR
jgi:FMN phosphatase YigB (HAD superfamily)